MLLGFCDLRLGYGTSVPIVLDAVTTQPQCLTTIVLR